MNLTKHVERDYDVSNAGVLSIEQIREMSAPILREYEVKTAQLFGSYANGTCTAKSDVDFLVEFLEDDVSILEVCGLQDELQRKLGISVDVVTIPIVNPRLKIPLTVPVYAQ